MITAFVRRIKVFNHLKVLPSLQLRFQHDFDSTNKSQKINSFGSKVQTLLYDDLRRWRKALAEESQKPLYMIIKNDVLRNIALTIPESKEDLSQLPGIGPKTMMYSEKILNIIKYRMSLTNVPMELKGTYQDRLEEIKTNEASKKSNSNRVPKSNKEKFVSLLFNDLRKWRKELSDETQTPIFMIIKNDVLKTIASSIPESNEDLLSIPGVGEKTLLHSTKIFEIIKKRMMKMEGVVEDFKPDFASRLTDSLNAITKTKPAPKPKKESIEPAVISNEDVIIDDSMLNQMDDIQIGALNEEQAEAASKIIDNYHNFFITGTIPCHGH
jgi:superfamily II DNA helicase RecQ